MACIRDQKREAAVDVILAFAFYGLIPLSFALFEARFKTMYGDYES